MPLIKIESVTISENDLAVMKLVLDELYECDYENNYKLDELITSYSHILRDFSYQFKKENKND